MQSISLNKDKLPCEEALDKFLTHISIIEGKSLNTIKAYRRDLTDFLTWLRDEKNFPSSAGPERIFTDDITGYLEHLGSRRVVERHGKIQKIKLSAQTMNRRLSAIKAFFRFCNEYGLAESDPTAEIKGARQDKKLPVYLTIDQVGIELMSFPT